jgi:phage shock protein A
MLVVVRNSYGTLAGNLELEKAALLENARTLEEALKSSQDAVIELTRVCDQLQADITDLETQLSSFTPEFLLSLENGHVL